MGNIKTLVEDVPDMVREYMIANPQVGEKGNNAPPGLYVKRG